MKKYIQILQRFNAWRRGEDVIEQITPRELGEAIDKVIEYVKQLEREIDEIQIANQKQKQ